MENQIYHWKKNLDSKFIAGEDLQSSLNGLKPSMTVTLEKFNDAETFDQTKSAKITVTGLFLKEVGGKELYKPVILNKTNAKFFIKEFNSENLYDWVGKAVTIYAQKDSRHGYVVRFKKYVTPTLIHPSPEFDNCYKAIHTSGFTMDKIRLKYVVSTEIEKLLTTKKD